MARHEWDDADDRFDDYDYPDADMSMPFRQRHSGAGIVSFVIGLVVMSLLLVLIVIAGVYDMQLQAEPFGQDDAIAKYEVVLGLFICACAVINVVGLCLGIAGLCQTNRNKLFPILGLLLNGLTMVGVGFLMIVGLAVAGI